MSGDGTIYSAFGCFPTRQPDPSTSRARTPGPTRPTASLRFTASHNPKNTWRVEKPTLSAMQPLLIFLPKPQAVPPLRTPQEPLGGRLGFALLFERRKLLKRDRKLILGTSDRSTGVQLAVRKGFDPKHSMGLISYVEHTYIYIYI